MAVTHRDSSPEPSEEPDSPMESNDDDEEEEEVEEVDEVEEIEEEEEEEVEEAVEEEDEEADEEEAKGSDDEEIEEVEEEEEEEEVEVEEGDEEEAKVHEDEEEEVEEEEEEVDEVEEEEVEEEEEEEHEADEEETNVHEDEEMDEVEEEEEEAKVHEDKKVDKGEEEKEADKEEAKDSIENQDSEAHGEKLRPVSSNTGSFERNPASPSNSARMETADNKNAFDTSAADVKSEVQDTHVSSEEKEHAVSLVDEKVIDVSSEKKVSKEDSALVRNFYLEANETHQPFLSSEKSIGLEDTAPLEAPKKELDDARKSDVILETEASHLHLRSDMKIQDNSSSLRKPTPQQRPRSSSPAPLKAPKKVLADVRKFDGVLEKEASHLHLRSDTKMQDDLSLSSKLTPQRRPRSSSPALEAPKKELADVRKSDGILEKEASYLHLRSDTKMQDDLSSSSKLTPRRRPRSSSPGSLPESLSKKPAMVCAFYAKGWCVRGKSCRFLHQKEESRENLVESSGKGVVLDAAGSNSETALKSQLQIQRDLVEQYGGKTLIRDEYKSPKFDYMDDRRSNSGHFLSRDSSLAIGSVGPEHRYYSSGSSMLPSKYLNNDPFDRRAENSSFQSSYQSYRSSYQSFSRPKVELIPPLKIPSNLPDSLKRRIAALEHSWEPSMPFRPSYHYGQSLTSSCNQYDPLIDSIEPRNIERTVSGHSANGEQGHNVQKSSFHQPHDVILDKSTNLIVAPENTAVDGGDGSNKPKEEKVPVVDHEVESANVNGADDKLSKELKAVRIFRVALVDFVKDLVKPFWREGRLSKDVHKTIVKKAVEKVLDSLQPQQVPNDSDSINEFLSISRPKLRKLVEGYVERYTKS